MDSKLLLIRAATLVYKDSQLKEPSLTSSNLIKELLATIKFPESSSEMDRSREMLLSLRSTLNWMLDYPAGDTLDRSAVLQRIRINTADEESLYYAFAEGIDCPAETDEDILKLKKQCVQLRVELRDHINQTNITEVLKQYYTQANFRPDQLNWGTVIAEVTEKLEKYKTTDSEEFKIGGMIDMVDLSDSDNVCRMIEKAGEETSLEGILKLGWQAINRMLGDHGGLRRGEFVLIGALQHNYKTGFTLSMFKHLCLYNTPYMRDKSKKPLILHISAENELHMNVVQLYISLRENETGEIEDETRFKDKNIPLEERLESIRQAQRYIYERMSANGYHVIMGRCDPSNTTFQSICDMVTNFEAQGYEIHAIVFDYLNMCNKAGCMQGGPTGSDTRDLFRRVRNFMAPRGITFITPAQLSTEAKKMVRAGVADFVKHLEGKGYYDSCGTVDQEVDLEIFIHKEVVNGESFLTIQRGKHRKPRDTDIKLRYTVLPFQQAGAVRDDINGPDTSRRVAGGGAAGSGNEVPWFATVAGNDLPG